MPQRVLLPCSACNGTRSVRSEKCEPCDGQGEVLVCPPLKKCLAKAAVGTRLVIGPLPLTALPARVADGP